LRRFCPILLVAAGLVVLAPHTRAQTAPPGSLAFQISLFERYLESLRQQTGIPGLSAAIVQDGRLVWDSGFGFQDVAGLVRATGDTPYPLLDISQAVSSTALFERCLERHALELTDRVRRWNSQFGDETATVGQLLAHIAPGGFQYDAQRYAALTTVIEQCAQGNFPRVMADEILAKAAMTSSVPSHDLAEETPTRRFFTNDERARYNAILKRVALPYKVDSRGRATKSDYVPPTVSASTGLVTTVRDLARFDGALDSNVFVDPDTRRHAWQPAGSSLPTGLGWFVQRYNGERVVWHFGVERDAYSALYLKVPDRNLTLILLANSDGLAAPYTLSNGDVTVSLFAQLFLKLFVV
jgi:CubicO group peptidase (beta-lactamase class C family)